MSHPQREHASDSGIDSVLVALPGRAYEVRVGRGLLATAGTAVRALAPKARAAIVADARVAALHGAALEGALAAAHVPHATIPVPAGEGSKSWRGLEAVVEGLLASRFERGDVVLALGGGVIGDLAGFAAAITRRGMRFVQLPSTLLAQVDSSVGGKTGINTPQGKNLVGAFHQPSLVLADTALLETLPARELRAGYAEIVKVGLLGDAPFFAWLEGGAGARLLAGGPERERAILTAVAAKAGIVTRDETETGERALLNLGHTFAHALEAAVGYDTARLVHGEAVAIGLVLAFGFSARLGLCDPGLEGRVRRHLASLGLPVSPLAVPGGVGTPETLLAAIAQDKKVSGGALTFILARGIGDAFVARDVPAEPVRRFLAEVLTWP